MECESSDKQIQVGVDEPNTGYYWTTLDNYYNKFVQNIKNEGPLVGNSFYEIAGSHFELHCGMSVVRHFEPVVRLVNNRNRSSISFSSLEWMDLVKKIKLIFSTFFDNEMELKGEDESSEELLFSDEEVKLAKVIFMGEKSLKISNYDDKTFYLKKENLKQLLEINSLVISSKLTTLKNLNFMTYYTGFVDLIKRLTSNLNQVSEKQTILETFCESLQSSLETTYLRECLLFYKSTILNEICVNCIPDKEQ